MSEVCHDALDSRILFYREQLRRISLQRRRLQHIFGQSKPLSRVGARAGWDAAAEASQPDGTVKKMSGFSISRLKRAYQLQVHMLLSACDAGLKRMQLGSCEPWWTSCSLTGLEIVANRRGNNQPRSIRNGSELLINS